MVRGHYVSWPATGAIRDVRGGMHVSLVKSYLECDGALLIGNEPELLEIADYMAMSGKPIWHHLSEIPGDTSQ